MSYGPDLDKFKAMITPDKVAYIVSISPRRVGVVAFAVFLELRHFPPHQPVNQEFQMALIDWESMKYGVICIPKAKEPLALPILKELGLRIADGVPRCFSSQGWSSFPIDQPNAFTIETIPGHFTYANDPAAEAKAFQAEDTAVELEEKRFAESKKPVAAGQRAPTY